MENIFFLIFKVYNLLTKMIWSGKQHIISTQLNQTVKWKPKKQTKLEKSDLRRQSQGQMETNFSLSPACTYPFLKIQIWLLRIDKNLFSTPGHLLCVHLTWPSHNCAAPVIFCVLRYTVKAWTLLLLHQEMVMTITLNFNEGHLCRAGEAPWNRSLRRRGIIVPFQVIVVKETWTEPGMGARGEQEEGKGWMLWVHENADTWAFWGSHSVGSWRGERTTLRGHHFCAQNSGQTRDPSLHCTCWSCVFTGCLSAVGS